jgi:hypothetical protein
VALLEEKRDKVYSLVGFRQTKLSCSVHQKCVTSLESGSVVVGSFTAQREVNVCVCVCASWLMTPSVI